MKLPVQILFFILMIICGGTSLRADALHEKSSLHEILNQRLPLGSAARVSREGKTGETIQQQIGQKNLTIEDVVHYGLLQNPSLRATLENMGIAQAVIQEASLIESPVLDLGVGFPVGKKKTSLSDEMFNGSKSELAFEGSLTQNLLSILQHRARKRIATAEYEAVKYQTADEVLRTVAEIRKGYFKYQASLQTLSFRDLVVATSQAALELAQGQRQAGNISVLDLKLQESLLQMAHLEQERARAETQAARENLARVSGLSHLVSPWSINENLPDLPDQEPAFANLETLAFEQSLDLAASRESLHASRQALVLARSTIVPSLELGVWGEADPEGNKVIGPRLTFSLPFFGRRGAEISKATANLSRNEKTADALSSNLQTELRLAYNELSLARKTAEVYHNQILPLQQSILSESLQHYNFMLRGNYQLLQAKENQIIAHEKYINALRDYWLAHVELERIIGGELNAQNHL